IRALPIARLASIGGRSEGHAEAPDGENQNNRERGGVDPRKAQKVLLDSRPAPTTLLARRPHKPTASPPKTASPRATRLVALSRPMARRCLGEAAEWDEDRLRSGSEMLR